MLFGYIELFDYGVWFRMVFVAFSFAMRPEVRVAFVDDFGIGGYVSDYILFCTICYTTVTICDKLHYLVKFHSTGTFHSSYR